MIVRHARAQGYRHIALIRDASMMGDEYAATFGQAMGESGLQVAGIYAINPMPSQASVLEAVTAAKRSGEMPCW